MVMDDLSTGVRHLSQPGRATTYYPNSPLSRPRPEQWTPEASKKPSRSLKNPPDDLWYIKYLPGSSQVIFTENEAQC